MINRRALKLNDFSNLVLDEFDTMLDMGFLKEVQKIIDQMYKGDKPFFFQQLKMQNRKASLMVLSVTIKE